MLRKFTIFLISLFLIITLTGCSKNVSYSPSTSNVVEYPNETQKQTVNGYLQSDGNSESEDTQSSQNKEETFYIVNNNSKKIHKEDCAYAKQANEANLSIETDYEALISYGYVPGKVCNPY